MEAFTSCVLRHSFVLGALTFDGETFVVAGLSLLDGVDRLVCSGEFP